MDNYSQLVERISKAAGLSVEEIDRKVEAKRAKLSGLVSKEGAAQIVAAELGIQFDRERLKISQLVQGMKRANILGKVLEVSPVRSFNKNGRDGKVVNLIVADESSNVKVVLWDTNHIKMVEDGSVKVGSIVEISGGAVRNGEVHLSSFSDIKLSKEIVQDVVTQKAVGAQKIKDAKPGQQIKTRALIVQVFDPRYFVVCPECGRKVVEGACGVHGNVEPKKRALLSVVLDDGSETIRSVLFGEQINKLGLTDEVIFSIEKFMEQKPNLLGEEKLFLGNVRNNSLYNTVEFMIEKVEEVDVPGLLKEMEEKSA